ncbi:MAG: primosomal protein N' [Gammaproteobacteria bacterium]|nr:MAG: primosomal protein N' [Gammaproteobacteria bacterium]
MHESLKVLLPIPHAGPFDYLAPDDIAPGVRVRVPWGNRHRIGVAWGYGAPDVEAEKLKKIDAVLDSTPLWDSAHAALLKWLAEYYHRGLGEVCFAAMPKLLRQKSNGSTEEIWYELSAPLPQRPGKQQQRLIDLLSQSPQPRALLTANQIPTATIRAAERSGWIVRRQRAKSLLLQGRAQLKRSRLTDEQERAIRAVATQGGFSVFMLHGVTGSGKTEVYLRLMQKAIAKQQQVLLLVPEIGLTPQTIARVQGAIDGTIALYHSGLSESERLLMWRAAQEGKADVLIGTRSAVLVPLPRLGLVIVDEEHDLSFKQQDGIRYHARDVAIKRAQLCDVPVLLGSATPSLESWVHAQHGRYHLLTMRKRPRAQQPVVWHFVDMRVEPNEEGLSASVSRRIRQVLTAGHQVLVFLNRRGYAPALHCEQCGWLATCQRCDMRMTYHHNIQRLICHHCDKSKYSPPACPECGGEALFPVGRGTERLETTLSTRFAPFPVIRIDRDSTRKKGALEALLARVKQGDPALLVGTQMLAKGHHFPKLAMVVVADADGMFFSADFRAEERGLALLMQVAGRAGRADVPGEVWVQTRHMDHPLFACLRTQGYEAALSTIATSRKALGWPPFRHLACCTVEALREDDARECASVMVRYARTLQIDGAQVLGPIPAPMPKRQGRYRWQWLISAEQRTSRHRLVQAVVKHFTGSGKKEAPFSKTKWSVDVDPQEMR